jgi:hypothetical protein
VAEGRGGCLSNPQSSEGWFRLTRVVRFKLPPGQEGWQPLRLTRVVVFNPQSADWCTTRTSVRANHSPHPTKSKIQNLKSKIGLSLGAKAEFLREFSVEVQPEITKNTFIMHPALLNIEDL